MMEGENQDKFYPKKIIVVLLLIKIYGISKANDPSDKRFETRCYW